MPSIRSVTIGPNALTVFQIIDDAGTKTLTVAQVPAAQNTIALIETWINGTWVPANIDATRYQVQVHVTSASPIRATVWVGDLGVTVPTNWWL